MKVSLQEKKKKKKKKKKNRGERCVGVLIKKGAEVKSQVKPSL